MTVSYLLHGLLDDLVDREADRGAGQHNYVDSYAPGDGAAARLAAARRVPRLCRSGRARN